MQVFFMQIREVHDIYKVLSLLIHKIKGALHPVGFEEDPIFFFISKT